MHGDVPCSKAHQWLAAEDSPEGHVAIPFCLRNIYSSHILGQVLAEPRLPDPSHMDPRGASMAEARAFQGGVLSLTLVRSEALGQSGPTKASGSSHPVLDDL